MKDTTVRIKKDVRRMLEENKKYRRETFNDVIKRAIKQSKKLPR